MIIWTGDNSPHNVWDNTEDEVIKSTVSISKIIDETFRDSVTIVPI